MQTSKVAFGLGIPTCADFMPGRAESLTRLEAQLGIMFDLDGIPELPELVEAIGYQRGKLPNHEWSRLLWEDMAEMHVTHVIQLQDDVEVAPNFWPVLEAMTLANPDALIALETAHPAAQTLARQGVHSYTTADGLIGVGYAMPRGMLIHFLDWRAEGLKDGAVELVTEDTLLAIYAVVHEIPIWSPIPTIIDHDVAIRSSYGNDKHPFRRPTVTWRDLDVLGLELDALEDPEFWRTPATDLGRFYLGVGEMAVAHSRDFTVAEATRLQKRECPPEFARFFR